MIVIGIIGKSGSGKTTILNYLKDKGYAVFNSDKKVKELYLLKEIEEKLRNLFSNSEKLSLEELITGSLQKEGSVLLQVESIIHPLIEEEIKKFINKNEGKNIFLEVPLLYEAGLDKYCDKVIMVDVDDDVREKRLKERKNYDIVKILDKRQLDISIKRKKVDYILKNDQTTKRLISNLEQMLKSERLL